MSQVTLSADECHSLVRLIERVARKAYMSSDQTVPFPEYEDSGMEALTACVEKFDTAKGTDFISYARKRIYYHITYNTPLTYHHWHHCHMPRHEKPHAHLLRIDHEQVREVWIREKLLTHQACFSPSMWTMIALLLDGYDCYAMQDILALPSLTVRSRYRKVLEKIRRHLIDNNTSCTYERQYGKRHHGTR